MFGLKDEYEQYLGIDDTSDPDGYMKEEIKQLYTDGNYEMNPDF